MNPWILYGATLFLLLLCHDTVQDRKAKDSQQQCGKCDAIFKSLYVGMNTKGNIKCLLRTPLTSPSITLLKSTTTVPPTTTIDHSTTETPQTSSATAQYVKTRTIIPQTTLNMPTTFAAPEDVSTSTLSPDKSYLTTQSPTKTQASVLTAKTTPNVRSTLTPTTSPQPDTTITLSEIELSSTGPTTPATTTSGIISTHPVTTQGIQTSADDSDLTKNASSPITTERTTLPKSYSTVQPIVDSTTLESTAPIGTTIHNAATTVQNTDIEITLAAPTPTSTSQSLTSGKTKPTTIESRKTTGSELVTSDDLSTLTTNVLPSKETQRFTTLTSPVSSTKVTSTTSPPKVTRQDLTTPDKTEKATNFGYSTTTIPIPTSTRKITENMVTENKEIAETTRVINTTTQKETATYDKFLTTTQSSKETSKTANIGKETPEATSSKAETTESLATTTKATEVAKITYNNKTSSIPPTTRTTSGVIEKLTSEANILETTTETETIPKVTEIFDTTKNLKYETHHTQHESTTVTTTHQMPSTGKQKKSTSKATTRIPHVTEVYITSEEFRKITGDLFKQNTKEAFTAPPGHSTESFEQVVIRTMVPEKKITWNKTKFYQELARTTAMAANPTESAPTTEESVESTTIEDWKIKAYACPPEQGYFEGDEYCFILVPEFFRLNYMYSLMWCKSQPRRDLVDQTDLSWADNIGLFNYMRLVNFVDSDIIYINGHANYMHRKLRKAGLVQLEEINKYRNEPFAFIGLSTDVQNVSAICKLPKYGKSFECDLDEIYQIMPGKVEKVENKTLKIESIDYVRPELEYLPGHEKIRESCDCYVDGTAACKKQEGGYVCLCKPGWTYNRCDRWIPTCKPQDCLNGAKCKSTPFGNWCDCKTGYSGDRCEWDKRIVGGGLLKEDPQEAYQQIRCIAITCANILMAWWSHPQYMDYSPISCRLFFFLVNLFYSGALMFMVNETLNLCTTVHGLHTNNWDRTNSGNDEIWLGITFRVFGSLVLVIGVVYGCVAASWAMIPTRWTCLGVFSRETSIVFYPLLLFNLVCVICSFGWTCGAFRALSPSMERFWIANKHLIEVRLPYGRERIDKVARNLWFCLLLPPIIFVHWLLLSLASDQQTEELKTAVFFSSITYTIVSSIQTGFTSTGIFEHICRYCFYLLPDFLCRWFLPQFTPIHWLSREEVRAMMKKTLFNGLEASSPYHPCSPCYISQETQELVCRHMTREYLGHRLEHHSNPDEAILSVYFNQLRLRHVYEKSPGLEELHMEVLVETWIENVKRLDVIVLEPIPKFRRQTWRDRIRAQRRPPPQENTNLRRLRFLTWVLGFKIHTINPTLEYIEESATERTDLHTYSPATPCVLREQLAKLRKKWMPVMEEYTLRDWHFREVYKKYAKENGLPSREEFYECKKRDLHEDYYLNETRPGFIGPYSYPHLYMPGLAPYLELDYYQRFSELSWARLVKHAEYLGSCYDFQRE